MSRLSAHRGALSSLATLALVVAVSLLVPRADAAGAAGATDPGPPPDGAALYASACAACHGPDGRGRAPSRLAFEEEVPDFTDCSFATREPDADWVGVAYEGGPTRGFSEMMPAFGDALTLEELEAVLGHIRGFCPQKSWPRGDLNLPRAMFTGKAFVEDEALFQTAVSTDRTVWVEHQLLFGKRFGSFNQFEVVVPWGWGRIDGAEDGENDWAAGLGDVALGLKTAPLHSHRTGTIVAIAAELILPTGKESAGLTKGTAVFEPYLAIGQDLRQAGFVQLQGGLELPLLPARAGSEGFWRIAYGRTITHGMFGRAFTPMIELLGKMDIEEGAKPHWDLVPQLQVTLNQRQHVMLDIAVQIPLDNPDTRSPAVLLYLLWDWFDGGFFEGW